MSASISGDLIGRDGSGSRNPALGSARSRRVPLAPPPPPSSSIPRLTLRCVTRRSRTVATRPSLSTTLPGKPDYHHCRLLRWERMSPGGEAAKGRLRSISVWRHACLTAGLHTGRLASTRSGLEPETPPASRVSSRAARPKRARHPPAGRSDGGESLMPSPRGSAATRSITTSSPGVPPARIASTSSSRSALSMIGSKFMPQVPALDEPRLGSRRQEGRSTAPRAHSQDPGRRPPFNGPPESESPPVLAAHVLRASSYVGVVP
jgi:hypothetical protein